MQVREFMIAGAAFLAVGIMLGAFGAHQLADLISEKQLAAFKTGVQYQLIHGVALMVLSVAERDPKLIDKLSGRMIWMGVILFSGSIYLLTTAELWGMESILPILGPITPLGGALMILGWLVFLYRLLAGKSV